MAHHNDRRIIEWPIGHYNNNNNDRPIIEWPIGHYNNNNNDRRIIEWPIGHYAVHWAGWRRLRLMFRG